MSLSDTERAWEDKTVAMTAEFPFRVMNSPTKASPPGMDVDDDAHVAGFQLLAFIAGNISDKHKLTMFVKLHFAS